MLSCFKGTRVHLGTLSNVALGPLGKSCTITTAIFQTAVFLLFFFFLRALGADGDWFMCRCASDMPMIHEMTKPSSCKCKKN